MNHVSQEKREAIKRVVGKVADEDLFQDIDSAIGFYLAHLHFSASEPQSRPETIKELKEIKKAASRMVKVIEDASSTARLMMSRAAGTDTPKVLQENLSRLVQLQTVVDQMPNDKGGSRPKGERATFIKKIAEILKKATGKPVSLPSKEGIGCGQYWDFLITVSSELPGFQDEGHTALTSAARRALASPKSKQT